MPVETAQRPVIVWFRDDLRLSDHSALHAAAETGAPVLCLYIHDETSPGLRPHGGASRWFLHHTLGALSKALAAIGGRLDIAEGPAEAVILDLSGKIGAAQVFWTRRYGASEMRIDAAIKSALGEAGVTAQSFNGQLLYEPWTVKTKTGTDFKVFTPFWKAARASGDPRQPLPAPARLSAAPYPAAAPARAALNDLSLLPTKPDWAGGLAQTWQPGEAGAQARLAAFLDGEIAGYAANRNRPDMPSTSRLAPFLRFGAISPRQIFHATEAAAHAGEINRNDADKFLSEIGWREFSYHLLFHFPGLAAKNFQNRFDAFPWRAPDARALEAWRRGRTGYPIVDAGMRELWQTGFMHNRVRMIVASFLIKDLLIDWRAGEAWFWDTLCDADPANNAAGWQWVAGSGADAAPYYRIFNPLLQGEKFDPEGRYVRKYIPELGRLGKTWVHRPWEAPPEELARAGIRLGQDYPMPVVDHAKARDSALAAFKALAPREG